MTSKITSDILQAISESIKTEITSKGMNTTGSAVNSLSIKGNKLYGNSYIYQLVHGRKPGKFPPVQALRDWVRAKLKVDEKKVNSVAYLVGRKIARHGTDIFLKKRDGVDLETLLTKADEDLTKRIAEEMAMVDTDKIQEFISAKLTTFTV